MWFGSGCRDVSSYWSYSINNNNISVGYAGNTDWGNNPCLYTVCTDCTLIASSIKSSQSSSWTNTHNFVCSSIPNGLTINDLVIESAQMGIGSGQSDIFIYPTYSYNASTKTVSITYNTQLHGSVQAINIYKRNS